MKKVVLFFVLTIFCGLSYTQNTIPKGTVLINSFDTRWNFGNFQEFIVLVNTADTAIDLNGYEIRTFGSAGESAKFDSCQFTTSYVLKPDSFLLISSFSPVNGLSTDFILGQRSGLHHPNDGYIVLRKILTDDYTDYADILKHKSLASNNFIGVPDSSRLTTNAPAVFIGGSFDTLIVTRGGVSGVDTVRYSGFGIGTDFLGVHESNAGPYIRNAGSPPLPVELSSFSAVVLKTGIKLNWQTETEVNNYGFEVERKSNVKGQTSEGWEKMGFVNGSGNSNSPKSYSFEDINVATGKYSYRLKQIDSDGKYDYSKTIEVNLNQPGKFSLSQNYPNPFNPTTTIKFSIPEAGYVKLTLYNILAQEIKVLVNETKEAGVHTVNFNASDLNSGLYIYKLEVNGLTQTRKMTLVK